MSKLRNSGANQPVGAVCPVKQRRVKNPLLRRFYAGYGAIQSARQFVNDFIN